MPATSVPPIKPTLVRKAPVVMHFNDKVREGYCFFDNRWEGEGAKARASVVASYFKNKGHDARIHEGVDRKWNRSKMEDVPYVKVYVLHPKDPDLYTWFVPTRDAFTDQIDMETATWFELQPVKN